MRISHLEGCANMRALYFGNELPHERLSSLARHLYLFSRQRAYPTLNKFLASATDVLRAEIRHLPASLQALTPPFDHVLDLVDNEKLRNSPLGSSIDAVFIVVIQLSILIKYFEDDSRKYYELQSSDAALLGTSLGLLASAAMSLSRCIPDIALVGAHITRLAFRLSFLTYRISQMLEPSEESKSHSSSWASVVPNVSPEDVQAELDCFHAEEKTPNASRIFISARNHSSVTISGPPSRLKNLSRTSKFFHSRKLVSLPIYGGLCHAPHIYSHQHVLEIMGELDSEISGLVPTVIPLSTSSGAQFSASCARTLFDEIITEILTREIQWDSVIKSLLRQAKTMSAQKCEVLVFQNSLLVHDLVATFKTQQPNIDVSALELIPLINTGDASDVSAAAGTSADKIAIVGMACRMPGDATDTEKFWELLEEGLDVHTKIPPDRFDVETHYDPACKATNASHTAYGCFVNNAGLFDAPFFNISPREALETDPMQRLALVTAYEALERSGYVPNRTLATNLHRIGTFYGQASDDYREVNAGQEVGTYFIPGGCRGFGPGRINYFFGFSGPSYSIDTACSSSLATIQVACAALWNGDVDMALAGGMNILTNSDVFAGLSLGHFLSKTPNACKTWDSEADGMKRLEDAVADKDNILGVILGAATNHSAEAVSITHPDANAQSFLSRKVMRSAGTDPLHVSYVEMHGTGTQAGDREEMKSVTDVFAPAGKRPRKQTLHIGSVKANVGHGEAVAGATALLKVLLMFRKGIIPRHVGIKNCFNPALPQDLDSRQVVIPLTNQPWVSTENGAMRIAVVNNFGASGGNTTIVIQEPPRPRTTVVRDENCGVSYAVAISAKSKVSLRGNMERMIDYIDCNPQSSLADLSYTTTARRYHYHHRIAVTGSNLSQIRSELVAQLDLADSHTSISLTSKPPVAFMFTGQGASRKSMNLELLARDSRFSTEVLQLDALARAQGFPSFIPVIDGSCAEDEAHSSVATQIALVAIEIALARYWSSLGVEPDIVIGHSLGEYAALCVAGVLSASDAIYLVGQRARLLEDKASLGSYKMMAARASLADIEKLAAVAGLQYEVACINSPKQTVLAGLSADLESIREVLQEAGYRCQDLDVAFAFHSSQTDPILDDFERLSSSAVIFHPPKLPVISPLLGEVVFNGKAFKSNYLRRATRETVNYLAALEAAANIGMVGRDTLWVELGPHPVCLVFLKGTLGSSMTEIAVPSFRRDENNWTTLTQSLAKLHCAGVQINWNEFHRPFEAGLQLLDLPTYAWNNKNYWIMYKGNWVLTKGNDYYKTQEETRQPISSSDFHKTSVQRIVEESFDGAAGRVVMRSNLMDVDLLKAAQGHKMNECGVVTSSIHADIAYTMGSYLCQKLRPDFKDKVGLNILNLVVLKGLVAQKFTTTPQLIQVSISTNDMNAERACLTWQNVDSHGILEGAFATAEVEFGDPTEWLDSWVPYKHLVLGRIGALEELVEKGAATRFSKNMAYLLFANNLVDYSENYRGMQSVVMNGLEAFADVMLTSEKGTGSWTVAPYFIDSVIHLAGFVMNVSDAIDTRTKFCFTPGWKSMRFARPLEPGGKYRSYVKMIQTEDVTVYLGDVYVLQDDTIIGFVGGIKFRKCPRILLSRFFSAPDTPGQLSATSPTSNSGPSKESTTLLTAMSSKISESNVVSKKLPTATSLDASTSAPDSPPAKTKESSPSAVQPVHTPATDQVRIEKETVDSRAISLIAREAGLDRSDLRETATFAELGIDSLMSLVISDKFRDELNITVTGSLFLEYPTIGDLRGWLSEYYS
nr:polyketide synthase [Xylaria schweinitzii]